eukprot:Seg965.9 transcript_id=Seg965.9/GoldUCD/mRNA.D3Y31 product="hypothetical protein" protein_id=Seg965.9/GoldUCD/D3Y31
MAAFNREAVAAQNYKEFILLYNKIAEKCFNNCINSFNEKTLTEDEVSCAEKCSGKMVNTNHRLMAVFMEIGPPVDKQLGLSGTGMGMSM